MLSFRGVLGLVAWVLAWVGVVRPKLWREQVVVFVEICLRVAQVPDFAGQLRVPGHQVFIAEETAASGGAGRLVGGVARLGW